MTEGISKENGVTVFEGKGIELYRLHAWLTQAKSMQRGVSLGVPGTLDEYRKQFDSTARTWKKVQAEVEAKIANFGQGQ